MNKVKPCVYIRSAAQISLQPLLNEHWMEVPPSEFQNEAYIRAVDPVFRHYLGVMEMRRMGLLMRRASVVSALALSQANVSVPDAIVTGTGLGCVESTEKFLEALCRNGEQLLTPTHFMQSTHNTVSSLIAIRTRCHGYNMTFSHRAISFDLALHDANLFLSSGLGKVVLVGSYDEVTPSYFTLLRRMGYVGHPGQVPCSETAASFVLSAETLSSSGCRLEAVVVLHTPTIVELSERLNGMLQRSDLTMADIDAVLVGYNGIAVNDKPYADFVEAVLPSLPQVAYKRCFGENYSVSASGFYAALRLLEAGQVPACLCVGSAAVAVPVRHLLLVNHSEGRDWSLTLLGRVG